MTRKKREFRDDSLEGFGSFAGDALGRALDFAVGVPLLGVLFKHGGRAAIDKLFSQLSTETLVKEKIAHDFRLSDIHTAAILRYARADTAKILKELEDNHQAADGTRMRDISATIPKIHVVNRFAPGNVPAPDLQMIDLARDLITYSRSNPIVVNAESIEAAANATWRSLKNRYGLNINLVSDDENGRDQMWRVDESDETDFIITADAPFVLAPQKKGLEYIRLDPLHREEQVLLRKPGQKPRNATTQIHVFEYSSAFEQFALKEKIPPGSEPVYHRFTDDVVDLVIDGGPLPGDYIISWKPLTDGLMAQSDLQLMPDVYEITISISAHKRWFCTHNGMWNRLQTLRHLFVEEWVLCKNNQDYAVSLLADESDFKNSFRRGSGFKLT